ncbi:MAG: YkvA family protein [Anaerolineae bacterium]
MGALEGWKQRVKQLKTETYAIYLAYKDSRVPWYAKLLITFVVAHTFSPIDLIPDFIPVLGYLDDLIVTPLGIALAIKMIPPTVLAECREKARSAVGQDKPTSWMAAVVVIAIWLLVSALIVVAVLRIVRG